VKGGGKARHMTITKTKLIELVAVVKAHNSNVNNFTLYLMEKIGLALYFKLIYRLFRFCYQQG